MHRVWAIASNTLAEIRRRRVVWVAVFVSVFVVASSFTQLLLFERARAVGEAEIAAHVGIGLANSVLQAWAVAAQLLAVFLGAGAVATELRAKTIVTILARPIERWEYLLGRWLGVQIFTVGFFVIGLLSALGLALYMETPVGMPFWLRTAEHVVGIVYLGGVCLALGTVTAPVIAGVGTFLLLSVSSFARLLMHVSYRPVSICALALYLLTPARMPAGLVSTDAVDPLVHHYGLFAAVLAENIGYAASAMLIACWWFARREVRIGE